MVLASQPSPSLDRTPDLVSIDAIVLVPDAAAAETYFNYVFNLYGAALVVSGDGAYPTDPILAERARAALANNTHLPVVIAGLDAITKVSVVSERILVLDDLILTSFRSNKSYSASDLALDAPKLARVIEAFFAQWGKIERAHSFGFSYRSFRDYRDTGSGEWRMTLVAGAK